MVPGLFLRGCIQLNSYTMKKLLVVFNGIHFPGHVLQYAIQIAKQSGSLIEGIFLKIPASTDFYYPFFNDMGATATNTGEESVVQEDADLISGNIRLFKTICTEAKVNFKLRLNITAALSRLLFESAYADLILIDSQANFNYDVSEKLNTSLRYLFIDAHCPVLAITEQAKAPEKIIIAYDGTNSCIYAIKAFSYLFPEWKKMPSYIVSVNSGAGKHLKDEEYIKDWFDLHFTNNQQVILSGDVKNNFIGFVQQHQDNAIVVMGAYGRNALSRLFRQSLADIVLQQSTAPLFLTHL